MFIRPALDPASETEGARLKVRDPVTMAFLADDGEEKPDTDYWLRRLVEGGVEQQAGGKWPESKALPAKAEAVTAVATNLDGSPASMEGEELKLTDEERAKLGKLEPTDPGLPLTYATGVSDATPSAPREEPAA